MEKLQEDSFDSSIGYIKAFRDDVELILSMLKEAGVDNVEITDDEYKYDSLDDLIENRGKYPDRICIKGKRIDSAGNSSSLLINLKAGYISITIRGDRDIIALGYLFESIFKKRRLKWYNLYIFSTRNALINIFLLIFLIAGLWLHSERNNLQFSFNHYLWPIVFWMVVILYSESNPLTKPRIELIKRHESSFYNNNKNKIIVTIIVGIILAIVKFLLG